MKASTELVINFHMTEACNYRCRYCYATWDQSCKSFEIHRDESALHALLERLANYFLSTNPLQEKLDYRQVRLNFAGGEPLILGDRFLNALYKARELGFRTSIITNAHFLDEINILNLADKIDVLGISFDTADQLIASSIGRQDRKSHWLKPQKLVNIALLYKELNPSGLLKINTVVNEFNHFEDLSSVIRKIPLDKWKILRVLPVYDHQLVVSNEQFLSYIKRHETFSSIIIAEDNEDMRSSYLMINPKGRFYQNGNSGAGYIESESILDVGVAKAIGQIDFDDDLFLRRYPSLKKDLESQSVN